MFLYWLQNSPKALLPPWVLTPLLMTQQLKGYRLAQQEALGHCSKLRTLPTGGSVACACRLLKLFCACEAQTEACSTRHSVHSPEKQLWCHGKALGKPWACRQKAGDLSLLFSRSETLCNPVFASEPQFANRKNGNNHTSWWFGGCSEVVEIHVLYRLQIGIWI